MLTPGNTGDVTVAPALIEAAGPFSRLLADKAYDANWLRELIAGRGAEAVIPCNPTRKTLIPYDAVAYRQRNLIERMFGRIKSLPPRRRGTSDASQRAMTSLRATTSQPHSSQPSLYGGLIEYRP